MPLTEQEALMIVYNGIIEQGKPSVDKDGNYLYRSPDGLKCGIGMLIPDEEYNPDFELHLVEQILDSLESIKHLDMTFLIQLQKAHDDSYIMSYDAADFIISFKDAMYDLANYWNLSITKNESAEAN